MPLALAAALGLGTALPALADATAMCLETAGASEALCACASEALTAEVGAEDAALYDAVGTRHVANKAAGKGMADAWSAAIAETAAEIGTGRTALLMRTNELGTAHRAAIEACR